MQFIVKVKHFFKSERMLLFILGQGINQGSLDQNGIYVYPRYKKHKNLTMRLMRTEYNFEQMDLKVLL